MDSHVTMEKHISSMCRTAYFHLRNISKIKDCLHSTALLDVTRALITNRLDYCNSLLYGLPKNLILKLQYVQNSAARMITGVKRMESITPALKSLHWLPIQQRTKFKILTLVHRAIYDHTPSYLHELLHHYNPCRTLCSSDSNLLVTPRSCSKTYQDRAFSIAGPVLWNNLPTELRNTTSRNSFRSRLKTLLFRDCYQ